MIQPMRGVLTGACGSIGSALVERLSRQGHELLVVCGPGDIELGDELHGIELLETDLSIPGPWQERLEGTALVIHLVDPIEESGDLGQSQASQPTDASMQRRIDSMFQVVWAIEQARPEIDKLVPSMDDTYSRSFISSEGGRYSVRHHRRRSQRASSSRHV